MCCISRLFLYICIDQNNDVMANTRKVVERNLKFNNTYIYKGMSRGSIESGQCTSCDNCGKLITNMVTVHCPELQRDFTIGTDCAATIAKVERLFRKPGWDAPSYWEDISRLNQCSRFITQFNKGHKPSFPSFQLSIYDDKGKEHLAYVHAIKEFYPERLKDIESQMDEPDLKRLLSIMKN